MVTPSTREVWYKGEVAVQFINPHTGRWATRSLRPPLPHESEKTMNAEQLKIEAAEWIKDHEGLVNPTKRGPSGSHNTHARLSPSDSKRWTRCTASIAYQEANRHKLVKEDTTYADEGSEAHEWAAKVLLKQCTIDEVPETGMLGNELRVHVASYVEHCLAVAGDENYEVEVQVGLFYQPEQKGTCDFAWLSDDRVVIRDYKHGAGVLVHAEENTQLAIYAYSLVKLFEGLYEFHPATSIDIGIFQPRHREAAGQKPWVITLADLAKFCQEIEYRAIQAREGANRVREKIGAPGRDVSPEEILEAAPGLTFYAEDGDQGSCRWCKVRGFCAKRFEAATADLDRPEASIEDILAGLPDLDKDEKKMEPGDRLARRDIALDDAYLVTLIRRKKAIESFLDDAAEYMEARLLGGEQIEGLKVVMGREGNRDWGNEEEADKWLKNQGLKEADRYEFKLKSPTKIEAALKEKLAKVSRTRNRFDELVTRAPARQVMALAEDKRPAVSTGVEALPCAADPLDNFEV